MPTPALLLLIATLLPLVAFLVLVFVGKRMGSPFAGIFGTAFISGSFVCSLLALMIWLGGGKYLHYGEQLDWGAEKNPIHLSYAWLPTGAGVGQDHPGFLDVGIYIDSLTVAMFAMITLVAALVHVFSLGYMRDDKRYPRFFTYLGLFCFSMLGLVLGGTLLHLFIFWELVGLCSYLLIGFWYEKKSASNAAIKAFIVNRVGDLGFLIGFGILFYHVGNVTLPDLWVLLGKAGTGAAIALPGGATFGAGLLTIMGIGLFFGAIGKSAQFPLHVWLPDAMEGPTPVSALIHAATMVAAGVYLVGRIFPILTPDAKLFIAIIGATTLTMAALIAVSQTDIKRVLAFSTISQLGYMMLAMGIGSWVGGLFHLITHAFFKALLFLASGSVIHAAHHEQEMTRYGGLIRKIPVTAIAFAIGVLAIAGVGWHGIGMSGYYSKDMILAHAGAFASYATEHQSLGRIYWLLWLLPTAVTFITAFYMARCWMLTFWGKPRDQNLYNHAHERPVMYMPLIVLALLSIFGGKALFVKELLQYSVKETENYCNQVMDRSGLGENAFTGFQLIWPADETEQHTLAGEPIAVPEPTTALATPAEEAHAYGWRLVHSIVSWGFIIGIGGGFLFYMGGLSIARRLVAIPPFSWINTWLYRQMYFDELYNILFVDILVMGTAKFCRAFDTYVIDGAVNAAAWTVRRLSTFAGRVDHYVVDGAVNGAGALAHEVGAMVRTPQTGRIRLYMTVLMVAIALAVACTMIVMLSS